jgi:hypothetical protein
MTSGTGIDQTGTTFSLKPATTTTLGGIIVDSNNFTVDSNGKLSLKAATSAQLGGVKITTNAATGQPIAVDANGNVTIGKASNDNYGIVKVGTGLAINDGVVSVGTVGTGGADLNNIKQDDTANSIAQRTADGSLVAHDLQLTGVVSKVNNVNTATGTLGVHATRANVANVAITNVKATDAASDLAVVAEFTPTVAGNFLVYLYFKILSGTPKFNLTIDYNDDTAQSSIIANYAGGAYIVGAYSVAPVYIYSAANQPIQVKSAIDSGSVKISASIIAL